MSEAKLTRRGVLATVAGAAALDAVGDDPTPRGARHSGGVVARGDRLIVQTDMAVTGDLLVQPGGQIEVAKGATLTLMGDLIAPASRLFTGQGRVDLTRSRLSAARPEWWGAVPDDGAVDCAPAMTACLRAHPAMQLGPGDYHLRSTLVVNMHNRRIWGVGRTNGERGTRLLRVGATGPVMLVGTERPPASINQYIRGVDVRWLELGRTLPAAAPGGDLADAAAGLSVRHVLDCLFEGLRANEHALGYSLRGAVRTFLRDCAAFRSANSGARGRDVFVGFDLDGRDSPIDTGANASLYLIDCAARTGGRPALARSIGCRIEGPFSDTFLVRFETTELAEGVSVDGGAARLSPSQRRSGNIDLHIDTPVLDQCLERGITIVDLAEGAMIDIRAPYIALAAGGTAALLIGRSGGMVGVTGGQLVGFVAAERDAPTGASIVDASGVALSGIKLSGFPRPVRAVRAVGTELVLAVNGLAGAGAHPVVELAECRDVYVRARAVGRAGAFRTGVQVDEASRAVTVETAGLPPSAFASGASVFRGAVRLDAPERPAVTLAGASPRG